MPLTKEAYKKLNDNTDGVRFIRPFSEYTLQEVIDELTELEELKHDVKRFMELMDKYMTFVFLCDEETNDEYDELSKKLMKVGKEEWVKNWN